VGDGVGTGLRAGVATGVVTALGLDAGGDEPAGVELVGVLPHAARVTPRRRDAARRFAFICRRWCCGLSRR
jgi:hypothetical protein